LARALEHEHPAAAASLREGLPETLTVTRLGIGGRLKRTLQCTNTIENQVCRVRQLNVKRWHGGDMRQRWTAAGILDAERNFRRIKGRDQLARLAAALGHELTHPQPQETDFVNAA
jgi:putative transposase